MKIKTCFKHQLAKQQQSTTTNNHQHEPKRKQTKTHPPLAPKGPRLTGKQELEDCLARALVGPALQVGFNNQLVLHLLPQSNPSSRHSTRHVTSHYLAFLPPILDIDPWLVFACQALSLQLPKRVPAQYAVSTAQGSRFSSWIDANEQTNTQIQGTCTSTRTHSRIEGST